MELSADSGQLNRVSYAPMMPVDGPPGSAWSRRELAAVTLFFALLTAALTYPLSVGPHDTVLAEDPDNHLFIWTLAWNTHALTTNPLAVFDANIYSPRRLTLAYSENLLGSTPFAAPVLWLTGNPVLAMNVVALLSVLLCGVGAYVLARQLGLGRGAALVCGIVFAFSPARFFRTSQIHLGPVQWIPFMLAYLHAYFTGGRRRHLRLALVFFTLQVATSGHAAVFAALAAGLLVAWILATRGPFTPRVWLRDAGLPGALLLGLIVLLAVPYAVVQQEIGLRRTLENWAAVPESWLASPTTLHAAVLRRVAPHVNEVASAFLFPGYVVCGLALVALVWRLPGAMTGFYAALALVCVSLSAGPPVSVWPLVYWLPGFNFIRGPSRFMILGVLALAVLAAIGLQRISSRLTPRRRLMLAVTTAALLILEFAAVPLHVVPFHVRLPAADRWLNKQPKPFVVAEFPVGPTVRYHSLYMLHSMAHWQKTVHGYSGIQPPEHDALYARMRMFPDQDAIAALQEAGVTYAVVHQELFAPDEWPEVEDALGRLDGLALVYEAGFGRVYRIESQN
jgi:hypothetical protein